METNKNIRIEEVATVDFTYPYLEVFYLGSLSPFLEVGITDERKLNFKFYSYPHEINLNESDIDRIVATAKEFLPKALKNEDDFQRFNERGSSFETD